jgi:hypothetical protein
LPIQTVTFNWSTENGECYECGLPAAFKRSYGQDRESYSDTQDRESYVAREEKLCAVCAANAAADGEEITRIREEY